MYPLSAARKKTNAKLNGGCQSIEMIYCSFQLSSLFPPVLASRQPHNFLPITSKAVDQFPRLFAGNAQLLGEIADLIILVFGDFASVGSPTLLLSSGMGFLLFQDNSTACCAFLAVVQHAILLIGPCLFTCGERSLPQIRESL